MQDLPFFFQAHDLPVRRFPLRIREPRVVPHVQLLHVQRFHAEILERLLGARGDIVGGEDVAEFVAGFAGPLTIHRRDLCGNDGAVAADFVLQRLTDHALAVAVAIGESGIEEGDALLHRFAQRLATFTVVHAAPHLAADTPGTEADFADAVSRISERTTLHGRAPSPIEPVLRTSRSGVRRSSSTN